LIGLRAAAVVGAVAGVLVAAAAGVAALAAEAAESAASAPVGMKESMVAAVNIVLPNFMIDYPGFFSNPDSQIRFQLSQASNPALDQ
jgi:hypothetical protein